MLNIIIFGAQGSGKGTQADKIISNHNLIPVSTGNLLREEIAQGTELGEKVKKDYEAGALVSDEIIFDLIKKKIENHPESKGFIFDGFPRSIVQAKHLDEILKEKNIPVSMVIYLDVNDKELLDRLHKRAIKENRADDTTEAIKNRLSIYREKTMPLIEYYQRQNKIAKIDGLGLVDDIAKRIDEVVEKI